MAKEYDNNNAGALFVNDKKKTDKHPDRTGQATIDGVEYWVSGWIKKSNAGKQYLSLAFTPKDDDGSGRQESGSRPASGAQRNGGARSSGSEF